jgi:ABC-type polysaccharide/polyol phosphate transport system ATPase subunit
MSKKEIKNQISLIDMQIGGLELKLGLGHKLTEQEKIVLRGEIMGLRDKRLALKGAFRLS